MCTATYIKDKNNRIIFTTNRDEQAARPTSPPQIHSVGDLQLLFPQDQLAGGTWVAVGQSGMISCILNGAKDELPWLGKTADKSRGQVLLDSFLFADAEDFLANGNFEKANPFTLLRIQPRQPKIFVIKWNGSKKWMEEFDANQPQIWSAYTLYPAEQRHEREIMFQNWAKNENNLEAAKIWQMHQASKSKNGLLLENSPHVNTVSTTQIKIDTDHASMHYYQMD
ncbi:NRDE family protein [Crocinitomix catalasitica]|uniref:NRDE family protein n=1 Tax=Crocinitomix catalasitica TaxID=184607 RepID=UPI0004890C4B|nr:NRDE family protein [Crocinitomix catalasitica]